MDMAFCGDLMGHLDDGHLKVGHAPDDVKAWLETLGLDPDFRQFMQRYWPQSDEEFGFEIGAIDLINSREIHRENENGHLTRHGLLLVGRAPNGDPLVLDFSTPNAQPHYLDHDYLDLDGSWNKSVDPRTCMQPLARSLPSLLWRAAEGRFLPMDYHAAKAFNEFLAREGESHFEPSRSAQ